MTKMALILGEQIVDLHLLGKQFPVSEDYHWVEVPDDTTTRDRYVGGQVVKSPPVDPGAIEEADKARQIEALLPLAQAVSDGSIGPNGRLSKRELRKRMRAKFRD